MTEIKTKIKVIRREGGSRIVAITDIIPQEWEIVEMVVKKTIKNPEAIIVQIEKVR